MNDQATQRVSIIVLILALMVSGMALEGNSWVAARIAIGPGSGKENVR